MRIISLLLVFSLSVFALEGKIIRVIDGDTVVLLTEGTEQIKVRLYGIDAPEKKEPGWTKSKQYLSKLIFGKMVELETHGKDKYRRTIAIIYLNGKDINAKMVKSGHAKAFVKYSKKYLIYQK